MALINVSINPRSPFGRIVTLLLGLALLYLGVSRLTLAFLGETTTAEITSVNFQQSEDNENKSATTEAHVQYRFTVDGEEYTGSSTFSVRSKASRGNTIDLSGYDTQFRADWSSRKTLQIRYLPMRPSINAAVQQSQKDALSVALRVGLLVLALVMLYFALKPGKKRRAAQPVAAAVPPGGYTQVPQQNPASYSGYTQTQPSGYVQTTPSGYAQTPQQSQSAVPPQAPRQAAFCPNCGAPANGNAFCTNCGARLQ